MGWYSKGAAGQLLVFLLFDILCSSASIEAKDLTSASVRPLQSIASVG